MKTIVEPFLKWAGGKRWLMHQHRNLLPINFNRYIEPFLGSGAVFFSLGLERAILSDTNAELINTYLCIKKDAIEIHNLLKRYQKHHNKFFFYKMRMSNPSNAFKRAARFIYLNRTCFNGLYRVNLQGVFNVPIGGKTLVEYPDGYLTDVGTALKHVSLLTSDFETVINQSKAGDFIYIDPPYTVMHNNNNFIKYNSKLFSWEDQIRLSITIKKAAQNGAMIMLSNADHKCLRQLYNGFGQHYHIERSSVLASNSIHRRKTTELIITNY